MELPVRPGINTFRITFQHLKLLLAGIISALAFATIEATASSGSGATGFLKLYSLRLCRALRLQGSLSILLVACLSPLQRFLLLTKLRIVRSSGEKPKWILPKSAQRFCECCQDREGRETEVDGQDVSVRSVLTLSSVSKPLPWDLLTIPNQKGGNLGKLDRTD